MTIEEIKNDLKEHIGKEALIKYSLGRNKYESYHVTIKELYDYVFLVELKRKENRVKSFSYADVITKTIKIDYWQNIAKSLAFLDFLLYTEIVSYTEGRDLLENYICKRT